MRYFMAVVVNIVFTLRFLVKNVWSCICCSCILWVIYFWKERIAASEFLVPCSTLTLAWRDAWNKWRSFAIGAQELRFLIHRYLFSFSFSSLLYACYCCNFTVCVCVCVFRICPSRLQQERVPFSVQETKPRWKTHV